MAKVAIYTLTFDRLYYTQTCFDSLYKTAGIEFDHYIVDNGSQDGTPDYLRSLEKKYPNRVNLILNPYNKGIVGSNQAINKIMSSDIKYDCICKVDNDCFFVTNNWLVIMIKIWEVNSQIALSPYVDCLNPPNQGGSPRYKHIILAGQKIGLVEHLGGICHFLDVKVYDKWRWSEKGAWLHQLKDVTMSGYLRKIGYIMGYIENIKCQHFEGSNFGQMKRYPDYYDKRREEEWVLKYGTKEYEKYIEKYWGINI